MVPKPLTAEDRHQNLVKFFTKPKMPQSEFNKYQNVLSLSGTPMSAFDNDYHGVHNISTTLE